MEARRHPMDFDTLKIGDVLSAEQCEEIVRTSRHLAAYQVHILRLKEQIERHLTRRYGRHIVVAQFKQGLRVLTESERVAYSASQAGASRRKLRRALRTAADTDPLQLTERERAVLERQREVISKQVAATAAIQRKFKPLPIGRTVPKMLEGGAA